MTGSLIARFHRHAGIAIGPILFVIALLGVLAAFFANDMGSMGSASREDSITTLLSTQANMIRSKFSECQLIRGSYPAGDGTGTLVSAVTCPGDPSGQDNLWTGIRPIQLPPPPQNFNQWTYYDYTGTGGGSCVKIAPATVSDAVRNGVRRAAAKFTSQEADYDSNGGAQSFVIWIVRPTGAAGANCVAG